METNGIPNKKLALGIGATIALSIMIMIIFGGVMTDSTTVQANPSDGNMRLEMMSNMAFMQSADYTFEDTTDRSQIENTIDRAPFETAIDRAPFENAVNQAPYEDAIDRAPFEIAVDMAPYEDSIDGASLSDETNQASLENTIDQKSTIDSGFMGLLFLFLLGHRDW